MKAAWGSADFARFRCLRLLIFSVVLSAAINTSVSVGHSGREVGGHPPLGCLRRGCPPVPGAVGTSAWSGEGCGLVITDTDANLVPTNPCLGHLPGCILGLAFNDPGVAHHVSASCRP